MLTMTYPSGQVAPVPPWPPKQFTVDEYHLMIEAGVFAGNERVELLEGWIVPKMARNSLHDGTILATGGVLNRCLPPGWCVRIQLGLTTGDSEPEPDLAIVRGTERSYFHRQATPADLGIVIEVADTSLSSDRNFKGRIYALASIGEYWIINVVDRQVEVYTDPAGDVPDPEYRQRRDYGPADELPFCLAGQELARLRVADLLP